MRYSPLDGRVAASAATSIQLAAKQEHRRETETWVEDVRPCLALYMLLAIDEPRHAPSWLATYMVETGVLDDVETWEPSNLAIKSLLKMRRHSLAFQYRHGAIVNRLLVKRLITVDPESGVIVVRSPSVLWERVDMMSRLYDEAVSRLERLVERWVE